MLRNYAKEKGLKLVAGLDEVGRGNCAGPVVTAAVILSPTFQSDLIIDSKKICGSVTKLKAAYELIMEKALFVHCDAKQARVINKIGIESAIWQSMHACIDNLGVIPEHLLIDGNRYNDWHDIPYTTQEKGDNTFLSIAAASIVAKYRFNEYMGKVHEVHPHYGWDSNNGYGTKQHILGILEHGTTKYHRDDYTKTLIDNYKTKHSV